MYMDYGKFELEMATTAEVFATWEENMKDFTNVAREGVLPQEGIPYTASLTINSVSQTIRKVHFYQDQSRSYPTPRTYSVSARIPAIS